MPFADTDQAIAFAFLPLLAVVLRYGWYRVRRTRTAQDRAMRGGATAP